MIMDHRKRPLHRSTGRHAAHLLRRLIPGLCLCGLLVTTTTTAQQDEGKTMTRSIADARALLMELEDDLGPFDTGLIEPLDSLAELQFSAGRLDVAESLLNRQLEIQRVNLGLHSASQIPVLESKIRLHVAQGDWEAARNTVSLLVWVHSRSDDINVSEHMDGLLRARAWLMLLLQRDGSDRKARHLLMYQQISEKMRQFAENHFDEDDLRQLPYLYESSKADIAMAMATIQNPMTGQQIIGHAESLRPHTTHSSYPTTATTERGRTYDTGFNSATNRSFENHMRNHSSTIDTMIEIARKNDDGEAEAMLTLYRGDSILLRQQHERTGRMAVLRSRGRGSTGTAITHYREAFEQLRDIGHDDEALIRRFGCPTLLPMESLYLRLENYPVCLISGQGEPVLENDPPLVGARLPGFSYDPPAPTFGKKHTRPVTGTVALKIGTNGQVTNSDVIDPFPDGSPDHAGLRRLMKVLQFRPALTPDGNALRTTRLKMLISLDNRH